jgi:hypothetical protein
MTLRTLQICHPDSPVSMRVVLGLRRWAESKNALFPAVRATTTTGAALDNNFLRHAFLAVDFGHWLLGTSTLNFIEDIICAFRPAAILEFGSGTSTACLAYYMRQLYGDSCNPYVFSIDESPKFAQETQRLLESLKLSACARVTHAPLREQNVEGIMTSCYDLSDQLLRILLGDRKPDFVLIDGPTAHSGASRLATLFLARTHLAPGARFFLDDGLRDQELEVARLWNMHPALKVNGVWIIDKGLLAGSVISNQPALP